MADAAHDALVCVGNLWKRQEVWRGSVRDALCQVVGLGQTVLVQRWVILSDLPYRMSVPRDGDLVVGFELVYGHADPWECTIWAGGELIERHADVRPGECRLFLDGVAGYPLIASGYHEVHMRFASAAQARTATKQPLAVVLVYALLPNNARRQLVTRVNVLRSHGDGTHLVMWRGTCSVLNVRQLASAVMMQGKREYEPADSNGEDSAPEAVQYPPVSAC